MIKSLKTIVYTFFISFLLISSAIGQNIRDTTILAPVFNVTYGGQVPLMDMANSFGINSNLGFSGGIKTASNWQFELEGNFMFSKNVKISGLLDPLLTSDNQIIASDGSPANIEVYQRGWNVNANIGKIFPVIGPNPNSGIIAKLGVGYIHHKVRIDNQNNLVPMLNGDNLKYFDRFTMGLMTRQFIGYQHLGNTNVTNFTVGLEFTQGFTRGMRDYQLDLEGPYLDNRLDFLVGLRVGWVIPVYRKAPSN